MENGKIILLAYLCLINTKKLLYHKEKPSKAMIHFLPIKFTQLKSLTRSSDGKIWSKHGARSITAITFHPVQARKCVVSLFYHHYQQNLLHLTSEFKSNGYKQKLCSLTFYLKKKITS